MSIAKSLMVQLESIKKIRQVERVEGSIIATVEISIDVNMDRDELDAAGILEDVDAEDFEGVVQHVRDNISDYSEIQDAIDCGDVELEDSSLDSVRAGITEGTWPDLDRDSVYLFQLNDGSMTVEVGGTLDDDGGSNIESIWLITNKWTTLVDTPKAEPAKVCSLCSEDLEADNTVLYCTQCVRDESSAGDETPELARE
jgi:hypothetical protein